MHRAGHYGAALVAYAPLGAVALGLGMDTLAIGGAAVAVGLSMLPDVDQRVPGLPHRGPTHTVWFVLAVAALLGTVGAIMGAAHGLLAALGLGLYGLSIGVAAVGSHLLADALTPAGIRPLTPWRSRHYSMDLVDSGSLLANHALLAAGVVASAGALALGSAVAGLG